MDTKLNTRNTVLFIITFLITCCCLGFFCYFSIKLKYDLALYLKCLSNSQIKFYGVMLPLIIIVCQLIIYIFFLKPLPSKKFYDRFSFELVLLLSLLFSCFIFQEIYKLYHLNVRKIATWFPVPNLYLPLMISTFMRLMLLFILFLVLLTLLIHQIKCHLTPNNSLIIKLYELYHKHQLKKTFNKQLRKLKQHFFLLQGLILLYEIIMTYHLTFIHFDFLSFLGIFLMIILPLLLELLLFYISFRPSRFEKDLMILIEQTNELITSKGAITSPLDEYSPVFKYSNNLCKLQEILKDNVEKQIKNERARLELITNISHDLKTPLTSIIGYIDLLKKEELSPQATHYIESLSKKAIYLNSMLKDLLDLSKIVSGNMPLELTKMDLNTLITQTLLDMEEEIASTGFVIKTKLSGENLLFNGDSFKLHRVCRNLLENALKYSLVGSRIFITTTAQGTGINLTIQNTSAYEMTFTPEEIVERFVRGDSSRVGSGCGLGLAIAKSYTELCNGHFELILDGDLFKVKLHFNNIQ